MPFMSAKIRIAKIGDWFDRRLQLATPIREAVEHPVPRNSASWWYVFGSAALTIFILQIVTGILLALIYVPSGAEAWTLVPPSKLTNAPMVALAGRTFIPLMSAGTRILVRPLYST